MARKIPTSSDRFTLRVPPEITRRANALIPAVAEEAAKQGFTGITRSVVLKKAILEGLTVMEKRYK